MTKETRNKALAFSQILKEDFSSVLGKEALTLPYLNFAEAISTMLHAKGETEQAAALGALIYCGARLTGLASVPG